MGLCSLAFAALKDNIVNSFSNVKIKEEESGGHLIAASRVTKGSYLARISIDINVSVPHCYVALSPLPKNIER